jgi:hypothetical protein
VRKSARPIPWPGPVTPNDGLEAEARQEGIDVLRKTPVHDEGAGLRVGQNVPQALAAKVYVDRDLTGADLQEGEEDHDVVDVICEHYRHSVAPLNAECAQGNNQPIDRRPKDSQS